MDAIYKSSSIYKMNSRYVSHGLSIFGEIVTVLIVLTIGLIIVYFKANNSPLTTHQILLSSTSLSMSSRLPTYIQQAANDFVFFTTFSNVSIKLLVDKLKALVPSIPDPELIRNNKSLLINNSITLENITFKSPGEKLDILEDINLKINKGAFVGFYSGFSGDLEALFLIIASLIKPIKSSNGKVGKVYLGHWDTATFPERGMFYPIQNY
jgi:ABC-type multidrug transport system fused ATPase/permease subunit